MRKSIVSLIASAVVAFGLSTDWHAAAQAPVVEPLTVIVPLAGETQDGPGCKSSADLVDPNAKVYADHLESRFNTDLTLCLTNSVTESVAMAGEASSTMVWVDQGGAEFLGESWRAAMVLRSENGLGRTPFVLFGLKSGQTIDLQAVAADRIGFLGQPPAALHVDEGLRILRDYELTSDTFQPAIIMPSVQDMFEAVEQQEVDAAIFEASTWGAACAVLDADSTICDGYEILMYDRPRATEAFMIPNTMSTERHYRLIGVHIALHLDHPDVFTWLSQGQGSEYEPAEADAMSAKSADTAVAF